MRNTITAPEGKIFTNGKIYGRKIHLAEGVKETDFYEITEAEYEAILASQNEDNPEIM